MVEWLVLGAVGALVLWGVAAAARARWRRSARVQDRLWQALELAGRIERIAHDGEPLPLAEESVPLPRRPPGIRAAWREAGGDATVWLARGRLLELRVDGARLEARWLEEGWKPGRGLVLDLGAVVGIVEFPDAVRLELVDRMLWLDLEGATSSERLWVRAWLLQGAQQARRLLTDATPGPRDREALDALRERR